MLFWLCLLLYREGELLAASLRSGEVRPGDDLTCALLLVLLLDLVLDSYLTGPLMGIEVLLKVKV